jgi:hypothetical protein
MKSRVTLPVDMDLFAATGSQRAAGVATDEFVIKTSSRGKSGASRAYPHGEVVCNYREEHVDGIVELAKHTQPDLFLHLTSEYPRGKDDFMRLTHEYLRRFARSVNVKRHVLAMISGDWQRRRFNEFGEMSWHIHAVIWLERSDKPYSLVACQKWLRSNWSILDNKVYDVIDPSTKKRKQVFCQGKKWKLGRVVVEPYEADKSGLAYGVNHHQYFMPEVFCAGRKKACRRHGICQYHNTGWEIFRKN